MRCELELDQACERLHLPAGALLHCTSGRVWITQELRHSSGPSPDIVLQAGERLRVPAAGAYFLTHLGAAEPARCLVELPRAPVRPRWALRWQ